MLKSLFILLLIGVCYSASCQNSYSKRRVLDAYAYTYDGDARVSFPNSDSLNLERTDAWTLETWVKIPVTTNNQYLFNKYDNSLARGISIYVSIGVLWVVLQNSSSNRLIVYAADSTDYALIFNSHLPANRWLQVCVTYDGSSNASGVKLYFNGKQYPKTFAYWNNLSGTIQNTQPVYLGGTSSNYSVFNQSVTRLYKKVLDSTEIATLYNNGVVNFNQNISRCILDMQVRNDHFSTNYTVYTVIDSALGNNGTTSGIASNQKFRVDSMRGMVDASVQNYTSSLYYKTFGSTGVGMGASSTEISHSPFTDRFRTTMVYDHDKNQTVIGFSNRGGIGTSKQSRLLKILHDGKMVTPAGYADYSRSGECDEHLTPGIVITPNKNILMAREWGHSSVVYVERTTGKSVGTLSPVTTINNSGSYPQFTRIGGNIFLWLRNGLYFDDICKSSDNGATWTINTAVTTTSGGYGARPYSMCVYDSTKLRYIISMSNDVLNRLIDNFYIESTDGVTFYNASHSWSKNIITSGMINKTELVNNCLAETTPGDTTDIMVKGAVVTPSGKIVTITNADSTHYTVLFWNGSTWQTKTLNIPNWVPSKGGQYLGRVDFFVIYPYSDSHFVFWRIENRNGYNVVVQYETTDFFDTIDAGTVISDPNTNHEQLNGTFNINDARKVVIAANALYPTENKLFMYEFTP